MLDCAREKGNQRESGLLDGLGRPPVSTRIFPYPMGLHPTRALAGIGESVLRWTASIGEAFVLLATSLWTLITFRARWHRTLEQVLQLGVKSVPIVALAAFFTGMVMAVHVSTALARFGASLTLADIVCVSILRELAPIFTALLVAGRAGSGIAAELGSMKTSDQLKAMRALSLSIQRELLAPRIGAVVFSMVALTLIGDAAGLAGGYHVGVTHLGILLETYHNKTASGFDFHDLGCGLFKAFFFGLIVAIVGCHAGLTMQGGASEVGRATKNSVVLSSILIIVSDYFLTQIYRWSFE